MISIRLQWDSWNISLLTAKLLRHAEKGEVSFRLETDKDSTIVFIDSKEHSTNELLAMLKRYISKRTHVARRVSMDLPKPSIFINDEEHHYSIEHDSRLDESLSGFDTYPDKG